MCILLVVGSTIDDKDNVYTILYVCGLITVDFGYEFSAKRAIAIEHDIEVEEHEHRDIDAPSEEKSDGLADADGDLDEND